jgi:Kdo2-lipid IVA lauroyltransferase/acyltransferase
MYYGTILNNKLKKIHILINIFRGILDHYNEKLYNAFSDINSIKDILNNKVDVLDEYFLSEAVNNGKGVILVTGHFGGIEFLPSVVAMKGYPVSIICRFQNPSFSRRIIERAGMIGINIIEANRMNTVKAALRALKDGRILITECDEFITNVRKNAKNISFLGSTINYYHTIDVLHKRSGSTLLFGLLKRLKNKKYELILHHNLLTADKNNTVMTLGEKCLKLLEEAIYSHPEQWYQWNKFGQIVLSN